MRACIYQRVHVFHGLAVLSVACALACALFIALDLMRRPQPMAVMNAVWPATALYGSVFALWFYWKRGRAMPMHAQHGHGHGRDEGPLTATQVTLATSHCGAGCALADIVVDSLLFGFAVTLAGSPLWASYFYDFIAAWALGIVFQYFSIKPMRDISVGDAIVAAIKADTLSIVAFQVGMYAFMALTYFVFFPAPHLRPDQPGYWLMMQAAMVSGFATAWPMNRFLIKAGLKEKM